MENKRIYTVGELITELNKFENKNIQVVIVSSDLSNLTAKMEIINTKISPDTDSGAGIHACVLNVNL